ncbi:hypothetical protein DPMN_028481 [Dreissena polymorpha]|uniref:Uncharacterized protein n=1 Tax=Dreissena polymorpha TaxID=45954 RepID=A0A9D4RG70_DREPO|nr:hypothetical protein DPMN_028481 [Dreissena polymorpha]
MAPAWQLQLKRVHLVLTKICRTTATTTSVVTSSASPVRDRKRPRASKVRLRIGASGLSIP